MNRTHQEVSELGERRTRRAPDAHIVRFLCDLHWPGGQERKKRPGGPRNPLKRLVSAKRIQGNQSFFSLIFLGWAWLGFAGFG
jgi:hypothetical protein